MTGTMTGTAERALPEGPRRAVPRRARRALVPVLVAAVLVLLPSLVQWTPVQAQLTSAGLLPRPPEFTELWLVDHARLSEAVGRDGRTAFQFVAHNRGTVRRDYRWVATAGIEGEPLRVMATGSFALPSAERTEVPVGFRLVSCRARNQVRVELESTDGVVRQSIHFWVLAKPAIRPAGQPTSAGAVCVR